MSLASVPWVSEENVETIRKVFAAFDQGDIEAVLRLCDEDIVITQPAEVPGINPQQRGHQGVLEAFAIWPEFSFVFTVRDEKIVEWQLFLREDQALEAARLSE
jgi:ketosteroid isomerase-like protein